jgi:hypothetical protein
MSLYEPLFQALNEARCRYVLVGGLAVLLHGHARLTVDIDLMIDLEPAAAKNTIDVLISLGLQPRAPVQPHEFADPSKRLGWMRDKRMQVFSMWDPQTPLRVVDLLVENPIDFDELWSRAATIRVRATPIRVASLSDLIALKRAVGRPQDLADVEALQAIARLQES